MRFRAIQLTEWLKLAGYAATCPHLNAAVGNISDYARTGQ
jgi:hypothetical protein